MKNFIKLTEDESRRYSRQLALNEIGERGQLMLKNSKVLIIGAGGLGVPCAQYLAAAGIGCIEIIDFDVINISNLPRQLLYNPDDVGKYKASVLAARLTRQNPFVQIKALDIAFSTENALALVQNNDVIIDCTDNLESRYLINDACVLADKPFVSAGVYKFEGQVGVFNYLSGPTYRCLYPETSQSTGMSCDENGVLGIVPGLMGIYQAGEALKIILCLTNILNGKIMIISIINNSISIMSVERNEKEIAAVLKRGPGFSNTSYYRTIDFQELNDLLQRESINFVDVRDEDELPLIHSPHVKNIPFRELQYRWSEIDSGRKTILFCSSGSRSRRAYDILLSHGIKNIYDLKPGAAGLIASGTLDHITTADHG